MAAPKAMDALLAKFAMPAERTTELMPNGMAGTLDAPRANDNRVEGDFTAKSRRFSLYTWLETHPRAKVAATAGVLAGAALLLGQRPSRAGRYMPAMRTRT